MPSHTMWTEATVKAIDAYQAKHNIPSFSAAAETLVRLGLDQSPSEVVQPIILSTIRREMKRVIQLISYNIVSTGVSQRMAGEAVHELYRMSNPATADAEYSDCKTWAKKDAGRMFAQTNIPKFLQDIMEANP